MPSITIREAWDVIERCPTGMAVVDERGLILFANPAAVALLQLPLQELVGTPLGVPLTGGKSAEIDIRRASDEKGVAEISALSLEWQAQPAYLVTFHDVTERHRAEQAVWHQAFHDGLTGLHNREHFHQHLAATITRAVEQQRGLAVLFLDLDRFKRVNDTLGHAAGDAVLRVVAERLRDGVRDTDVVARMSGDEFTVLLEGVDDRETALQVAQHLRQRVCQPVSLATQTVTPRATIGISLFPDDAEDVDTLLMRADTAMYHGKQSGRNQTRNYNARQAATTSRRFRLEHALHRALAEHEFRVYYQPQATLPDGRITDVEALLRWADPDNGLVSPAEFVPLLEETGMIHAVGEWVFRQAIEDLTRWQARDAAPDRIWVNIAARQLADHELHERLDQLVANAGLTPDRFGIELGEAAAANDIARVATLLAGLRARGYRISMDDFGTGYSALSALSHLPLHEIKIDRAFIRDMTENPTNRKLAQAIMHMAHGLNLRVVAEGVETPEQLDCLRVDHCDRIQGFLVGEPMTAARFLALPRFARVYTDA